jgi:type I restriction enzyme S subunit
MRLRQSILQDAIEGKLVPQDSKDEPASELLKKIKLEKEQLIKDKKIKKEKNLSPITDNEKPFDLSNGWKWTRLSEISINIHY